MILLHTVPYLRRKDKFTSGDKYGAWVAHQDLVRAILHSGAVDGVHFYLPFLREYSTSEVSEALRELRDEFPGQVVDIKRISDLRSLALQCRYVLADNFETFPQLAMSRYARDGRCLFPICGIVHTVPYQAALLHYAPVIMLAEAFDHVITTSTAGRVAVQAILDDIGRFMMARLNLESVPKVNITQIPLAVDDGFLFPQEKEEARLALKLPLGATIILYLGRLSQVYKADLEPLIVTFKRLSVEYDDLLLMIGGHDTETDYAGRVMTVASEYGVAHKVIIRTNFPYCEKPTLYSAADIFVSPVDSVQETFGLSILEAMASGLPVVASDWSGYREIVVHGVTGLLVPTLWNSEASEAVSEVAAFPLRTEHYLAQQTVIDLAELYRSLKILVADPGLRLRFGECGRTRVGSHFSWASVMKIYQELWIAQWKGLDTAGKSHCPRPGAIGRYFSHFATSAIDVKTHLRHNNICDMRARFLVDESLRVPHQISLVEAARVLDEIRSTPQSLEQLVQNGNKETLAATTWLWKKGYLAVDGECSAL
jgi:glycosyltransferase involved in cell wall biosynthesis